MIHAAVPFGMTSADFKQLAATVAIAACAAFVVVVLVMCLRDVLVARYAAKAREEEHDRPVRQRGRQRLGEPPKPTPVAVANAHQSQVPVRAALPVYHHEIPRRPPAADPTVWPEPVLAKDARLRTPSPASDRRGTSERVSGTATDRGDRTRLDISPTEEPS